MASIIGGLDVLPFSIQGISSSRRLCKFAYTRLDGRIDEGRLTNSPFPRAVRLRGTRTSKYSDRVEGLEEKRGKKENAREITNAMALILTPSRDKNELFASEVGMWYIVYGATVSAVHRED